MLVSLEVGEIASPSPGRNDHAGPSCSGAGPRAWPGEISPWLSLSGARPQARRRDSRDGTGGNVTPRLDRGVRCPSLGLDRHGRPRLVACPQVSPLIYIYICIPAQAGARAEPVLGPPAADPGRDPGLPALPPLIDIDICICIPAEAGTRASTAHPRAGGDPAPARCHKPPPSPWHSLLPGRAAYSKLPAASQKKPLERKLRKR